MMTEENIKDILETFDQWIIPESSCWEFPKYNLKLKYNEVRTAMKVLNAVLNFDSKKIN